MSKSKTRAQILQIAKLAVFGPNPGQPPKEYAADQMKGRGDSFGIGQFRETGRKLVVAEEVNGVAFVTLWRCKLTEAAKDDVMGYQVIAYDLAGGILHASPLDDSAPKSEPPGWNRYREVKASVAAQGDDLIYAAVKGQYDATAARLDELAELVELLAPEVAPADAPEAAAEEA
ncbi:MAG: hypothetical protein EHM21_13985 [Chloroflexi bacterium]|jgi:hypothetical protein|nr:MAG: hypothetical protein EHM21_13985 [Chloroflexota bacterium]